MRLNWFSPLPPACTAIADFSAQLLPFLSSQAEVTVWTDQEQWDRLLTSVVRIRQYRPFSPPWRGLNRAEVNVYHMGNHSGYHGNIWRLSQSQPGIIVLHDCHFHDFVASQTLAQGPSAYVAALTQRHGVMGTIAAESYLKNVLSIDWLGKRFPLTELVLGESLGAVVHTNQARRAVERLGRYPVLHVPLPYHADFSEPMQRASCKSDVYHLIVFGHIGRNRCLHQVLQALAKFPRRNRFVLDVYGEVEAREDLVSVIRQLTLEKVVQVHGRVPEAILDAALARSDLAINLRYPTMYEASHSQLRIWNHALPSIVTRIGWYASLPYDTVAMVRPRHEIADLQQIWNDYLTCPARFRDMGTRGKQLLQARHTPMAYVTSLLGFCNEVVHGRRMRATEAVQVRAKELAANDFSDPWQHRLGQAVVNATRSLGWLEPGGSTLRPPLAHAE